MTYNPYGFNSSYLDMAQDLGDPRRQEKLPGGYATQGPGCKRSIRRS